VTPLSSEHVEVLPFTSWRLFHSDFSPASGRLNHRTYCVDPELCEAKFQLVPGDIINCGSEPYFVEGVSRRRCVRAVLFCITKVYRDAEGSPSLVICSISSKAGIPFPTSIHCYEDLERNGYSVGFHDRRENASQFDSNKFQVIVDVVKTKMY